MLFISSDVENNIVDKLEIVEIKDVVMFYVFGVVSLLLGKCLVIFF